MRISDWSSDVCSSDLNLVVRPRFPGFFMNRRLKQLPDVAGDDFGLRVAVEQYPGLASLIQDIKKRRVIHGVSVWRAARCLGVIGLEGLDRKSTRLNSSH